MCLKPRRERHGTVPLTPRVSFEVCSQPALPKQRVLQATQRGVAGVLDRKITCATHGGASYHMQKTSLFQERVATHARVHGRADLCAGDTAPSCRLGCRRSACGLGSRATLGPLQTTARHLGSRPRPATHGLRGLKTPPCLHVPSPEDHGSTEIWGSLFTSII